MAANNLIFRKKKKKKFKLNLITFYYKFIINLDINLDIIFYYKFLTIIFYYKFNI